MEKCQGPEAYASPVSPGGYSYQSSQTPPYTQAVMQPMAQVPAQPAPPGQVFQGQAPLEVSTGQAPPGQVMYYAAPMAGSQQQGYPPQAVAMPVMVQQPVQMQQTTTQQYQIAVPLASLNQGSAPVDCPACHQRAMTNISHEVGGTTHAWAALLCFFLLLGCIPYMMTEMKDVAHRCSKCGALLATWHRSGRTIVHLHG